MKKTDRVANSDFLAFVRRHLHFNHKDFFSPLNAAQFIQILKY